MGVLVDWPGEDAAPRRFVFLASEKSPPACAVAVLQVEQQARALEELNALYVALTRAEERLVLSSFEPHQRGSSASWYQRLQPLATPIDAPEPASAVAAAAPAASADFTLAQLPVCTPTPGKAMPSAPALEAVGGADDEHTRIGLALHRLLQWFPTPADGFDWTTTHTQAAAREFGLSPAQAAEALAMARRIVAGKAAWAWDATQLDHWGNEVELFHQGELLRLDRLVRQRGEAGAAGTWWVLDFKSHEHPERQPEYLAQMQRYRQAMALARPGEPVRLAFINPLGQLIPLSPEQLAS